MLRARIIAGIIILLAIVAAVTLTVLYFVYPFGRVSHDHLLTPGTAVRAVFAPARVQRYVSRLAPDATRFIKSVPRLTTMQGGPIRVDWIHALPYEFSFLVAQDRPDGLGVVCFINEQPESDFEGVVNRSGLLRELRPVQWQGARFTRDAEGGLVAQGQLAIPPEIQRDVALWWPDYRPFSPPPIEGRHLIECSGDNSNGALMQLHGALARRGALWPGYAFHDPLMQAWSGVQRVWFSADLAADDELRFRISVHCTGAAEAGRILQLVEEGAGILSDALFSERRFQLTGGAVVKGNVIEGEYTLTGFEPALRRALGA